MVPEDNSTMQNSYLLIDEDFRFLNCQDGKKIPSKSILSVGVEEAFKESGFDHQMFDKREGRFEWNKENILGINSTDRKSDPTK